MSLAKKNILRRLRQALQEPLPIPYPEVKDSGAIFPEQPGELLPLFLQQFEKVGGYCYTAPSFAELVQQLQTLIEQKQWQELHCKDARLLHLFQQHQLSGINQQKSFTPQAIGISSCIQLVARTGSILLGSHQASSRQLTIAADVHIVVADENQLVYNIHEAFSKPKQLTVLPSMLSLTTGASRTADIEKTLVMGAHGPRALYLFLRSNHKTK